MVWAASGRSWLARWRSGRPAVTVRASSRPSSARAWARPVGSSTSDRAVRPGVGALVRLLPPAYPKYRCAAGFAIIFFTTLANTVLQMTTPDALRGRVMSVYTTVFVRTTPLGNLLVGGLAEARGVGAAFLLGGAVSVAAALGGLVFGGPRQGRPRS